MGKMSREKGKVGEREVAGILRDYGYDCRRGQQFCGANGDADVVGLPGIHIEVKRVEKLNLYDAVDQAKRDAKEEELPAVFHRKNRCDWLVTMPLENFMEIYREYEAGRCLNGRTENVRQNDN
jgi:Holliday junction resolvase